MTEAPGILDARIRGLPYRIVHPGHVTSVQEVADRAGVQVGAVVKTLVVRRDAGDFILVLVPGDRSLSWKKLRSVLGVNRLSLPDAETAFAATGYVRGTITPLGLDLPVMADVRLLGLEITLGTGETGTIVVMPADAVIESYSATIADITDDA